MLFILVNGEPQTGIYPYAHQGPPDIGSIKIFTERIIGCYDGVILSEVGQVFPSRVQFPSFEVLGDLGVE